MSTTDRATTPTPKDDDNQFDLTLRPIRFDDFTGQSKLIENLKIFITAAKRRGDALERARDAERTPNFGDGQTSL